MIPVCAGISLEYYFSCVDTTILGCGSKLPHNITSLLGVMEGAASDLRPGLSQQMIEIHEPMRILFVIETTPEAMFKVMERNPVIARLCRNELGATRRARHGNRKDSSLSGRRIQAISDALGCHAHGQVVGRLVSRLARSSGLRRRSKIGQPT